MAQDGNIKSTAFLFQQQQISHNFWTKRKLLNWPEIGPQAYLFNLPMSKLWFWPSQVSPQMLKPPKSHSIFMCKFVLWFQNISWWIFKQSSSESASTNVEQNHCLHSRRLLDKITSLKEISYSFYFILYFNEFWVSITMQFKSTMNAFTGKLTNKRCFIKFNYSANEQQENDCKRIPFIQRIDSLNGKLVRKLPDSFTYNAMKQSKSKAKLTKCS